MSAQLTKKTDSVAELTITLDQAALIRHVEHAYDELRPKVKAAGFRPGKAPNMIVERELGADVVQNEVVEHAIMHTYSDAVRDHKLPVVAPPEVSVVKFVPYTELEYEAKVELMPPVKLPDYKKITVKRPEVKIEAAEIDQVVEDLRKRAATRLEVQRPAQKGDEVIFDFHGTKGGEAVKGASATDFHLTLGSGNFIPGFEEELIGLKPAAKKDFEITFPVDYHDKGLSGQKVNFNVVIKKIEEMVLPELDQTFVEQVGPFKSLDELKKNITEQVTAEKAENASREFEQSILNELVSKTEFTPPPRLVEQQLARLKEELLQNLSYSGLDMDKYLQMTSKTAEQLDTEMKPEAEKRVTLAVALTEIARAEGIKATDEDIDEELASLRGRYTDPGVHAELNNPATREEIYNHLMASRVIAKLVSYVDTKN